MGFIACFFDLLTPDIEEAEAMRNSHVPIAILGSTIILATVLIPREAYVLVLDAVIPYPELIYR